MSTTSTSPPATSNPLPDETAPATTDPAPKHEWYNSTCAEAIPPSSHATAHLAKTSSDVPGSRALKAVMARSERLWENGKVLKYAFLDINKTKTNKVRQTITEWMKYGNFTFEETASAAEAHIRIGFNARDGSWSYVGTEVADIAVDQATMNLAWVTGDSQTSPDEYGVILHEFGHTLGLMHEHQSPLRGDKIELIEDAVYDFYMDTQKWSREEVKSQIIDVYNTGDVSNYSELDEHSIMMYFMPAAMNKQHHKIDPTTELSPIDKAFMLINYPIFESKEGTPSGAHLKQFLDALDLVGVDGEDREKLIELFKAEDWREIRYEFTNFCNATRIARKAHSIASNVNKPLFGAKPESPSSEEFNDGCISESLEDALGPSASRNTTASRGVATVHENLWAPGEEITYSWIQGKLQATDYRRKRVKETLDFYSKACNLTFKEIPYDPLELNAKMHIYFGTIPIRGVTGWCKIGKESVGYRQSSDVIAQRGGTVDSSAVFTTAVPAEEPKSTDVEIIKREQRTLYHELGHALGLKHEHVSPNTATTNTPDTKVSVATVFDEDSVMLYANQELRDSPSFEKLKTKFNHVPSKLDLAFLGALYPARPGHVDDKFQKDIEALGLKDSFKALDTQRQTAFRVEGKADFAKEIKTLREKIQEGINAIVSAKKAAAVQGPSHAITTQPRKARDVAATNANGTPTTGSFVDELVKTLSSIFQPTSGQIFALQFPGRFLQRDLYAWDTKKAGVYGQFVKPTVVNESEFRLVDQLYNVGKVIGAPSGINLSIVYEQLLNNLVPGIQESAINMSKQQDQIRKWLLRDVPVSGWVKDLIEAQHQVAVGTTTVPKPDASSSAKPSGPAHAINASNAVNAQFAVSNKLSDDSKINRMELAEALMQEYLTAKQAWEEERDKMIRNEAGEPLDDITRKLAHITAIREAQLAAKYSDAVVRGYSHTIRQYMGYMDIKSPAEILQDAKDSLRESAASSLDGSMKVYPVQMQPIDWFESLSTSFTMEDLTSDPELIAQQIDNKAKQLDALNTRLAVIQSGPKADIADLQKQLDTAQSAYDQAQANLSMTYTSNVLSLAKTCIDANNEFNMSDFTTSAKAARIAEAAFANIESGMKDLCQKQLSVTQTSRAVSQLMAAKSLAEASDTTQEVVQINVEIASLQRDINELTSRLQSIRYKEPPVVDPSAPPAIKPEDTPLEKIPDMVEDKGTSGGSRWQEVRISHTVENRYSAASSQSQASTSKTDVSLFFGSYHSENNQSSASSSSAQSSSSNKVDIGFRATMVTVDRGGWFQPQFFKQSNAYHSIDPSITWNKWPAGVDSIHDFNHEKPKNFEDINKYLLPAYPTGFIICKDITIKIAMSATDMKAAGSEMESYAATSAGILCWSTSSSNHNKASEKSYGFQMVSDGCIIRIPGPQILGYILQITDDDKTTALPVELPQGFLISDEDYDAALNSNKPAHGINTNTGEKTEDKPADKPSTTPVAPK